MIRRSHEVPREHVLLPIAPTANGRLHLGHIGGPMLKLDVLARHLRRMGGRVSLVGSTDPYDSYVLLRGQEKGQPPTEVVDHWHPLIERDLNAVGIVPDRFMNFLDPPWRGRNHRACEAILRDLRALGLVTVRRERFPYCTGVGAFATGGFVRGRCPDCAGPVAGYFCEQCGLHFRPEQVVDVRCGFDDCAPEWREIPCLYARLPDPDAVVRRMADMGVPSPFERIVRTYLRSQGPELRLTHPGTWGVPVPVEGSPVHQVAFTYVVGGLAFLTLSARIGAEDLGLGPDHPPRTVTSFGYDNALPFLLGGIGLATALPGLRPTDHMLLNHFMTLDGSKFSTSRDHVIWAGDLAQETGGDVIRAYLAENSPDRSTTDFSRTGFADYHDEVFRRRWRTAVEHARATGGASEGPLPSRLADRLDRLLSDQECALDPADQDLQAVMAAVHAWVDDGVPADGSLWWLRGLAFLAAPVTPDFAGRLWRSLGLPDEPSLSRFTDPASALDADVPSFSWEPSCATP
ncbi:class I tRNA ligase family protein [Umezawaea endophytica]|uniref:Class I tRNA ligase family protein n=1 Tax=Umezawaea endophytica TaxID=1654476 RepID=A0A9X3AFW6_9PSEU|nr:class I tRNA ligase family protein [Umezawaea endophytica]MCS7477690.1 class I tRNA ligase family protein [Umezawaea endophytica]